MLAIDHIAIWSGKADRLVAEVAAATDLPVLQGFSPRGATVARGVRFPSGTFLDVHDAPAGSPTRALLGLKGTIREALAIADAHGWRVKVDLRAEAPDQSASPPWSILSFRRGQGVLSSLFVIEYHPGAATSDDYAQPLYDPGSRSDDNLGLQAVWLAVSGLADAQRALLALGAGETFGVAGENGVRVSFAGVDIILTTDVPAVGPGPTGFDLSGSGRRHFDLAAV